MMMVMVVVMMVVAAYIVAGCGGGRRRWQWQLLGGRSCRAGQRALGGRAAWLRFQCRRTAGAVSRRASGAQARRGRVAIVAVTCDGGGGWRSRGGRTGGGAGARRCRWFGHRAAGVVEATVEAAPFDAILDALVGRRVLMLMVADVMVAVRMVMAGRRRASGVIVVEVGGVHQVLVR